MNTETLLTKLNFSRRHRGTYVLDDCIRIVLKDEQKLLCITEVYREAGENYHISGSAVERNIHNSLQYAWTHGAKEKIGKIIGDSRCVQPTASELIELLVNFIKRYKKPAEE